MRPTILLFDIDGTLITTGGAGRRALEVAFERRFGSSEACNFRLDGMTDRAIARIGLEAVGAPATQEAIDEILEIYLAVLKDEVARADEEELSPPRRYAGSGTRRSSRALCDWSRHRQSGRRERQ